MFDAVIVGAGLAGLSCAVRMEAANANIRLLEADDAPGGRIRTDLVDGFRLDRGFQILLTGYPSAQEVLDPESTAPEEVFERRTGPARRSLSSLRRSVPRFTRRRHPVGL